MFSPFIFKYTRIPNSALLLTHTCCTLLKHLFKFEVILNLLLPHQVIERGEGGTEKYREVAEWKQNKIQCFLQSYRRRSAEVPGWTPEAGGQFERRQPSRAPRTPLGVGPLPGCLEFTAAALCRIHTRLGSRLGVAAEREGVFSIDIYIYIYYIYLFLRCLFKLRSALASASAPASLLPAGWLAGERASGWAACLLSVRSLWGCTDCAARGQRAAPQRHPVGAEGSVERRGDGEPAPPCGEVASTELPLEERRWRRWHHPV